MHTRPGLLVLVTVLAFCTDRSASGQTLSPDTTVTTSHRATVNGEQFAYDATAGTMPVRNDDAETVAYLFYTYYERSDVDDVSTRPLVFSFNGGPGSASVWMHIGYTGPKLVKIDDEGYPTQPYGVAENPHTILDVADIVFIDPVNTGFSRIVGDADREQFFGVDEDVEYLARWIDEFVSRNGRWTSPKYLIGESYGTTRVAGLAARLQNSHWMFLNGVVLVSPTGLGIDRDGPVSAALKLPYYTAAAWYHNRLPPDLQQRDLEPLLGEVEDFTINELLPALARGANLAEADRASMASEIARYSALPDESILDYNLRVPTSFFWKELLRDEGKTVGRLDSRYRGTDRDNAGVRYDRDPALTAWNHAFTPAINHYLRDVLRFKTDLQYWIFGPVHPWERDGDTTGDDLQGAMSANPYLKLLVQSGYYDGATDYFSARYTMWNMDPSGRLQDRMRFEGYRSGHMMYLRREDLGPSNDHIRQFILDSAEAAREPARY